MHDHLPYATATPRLGLPWQIRIIADDFRVGLGSWHLAGDDTTAPPLSLGRNNMYTYLPTYLPMQESYPKSLFQVRHGEVGIETLIAITS